MTLDQQQTVDPMDKHLRQIVSQPGFKNVPVKFTDVANAKAIAGPEVPGLKGKIT